MEDGDTSSIWSTILKTCTRYHTPSFIGNDYEIDTSFRYYILWKKDAIDFRAIGGKILNVACELYQVKSISLAIGNYHHVDCSCTSQRRLACVCYASSRCCCPCCCCVCYQNVSTMDLNASIVSAREQTRAQPLWSNGRAVTWMTVKMWVPATNLFLRPRGTPNT